MTVQPLSNHVFSTNKDFNKWIAQEQRRSVYILHMLSNNGCIPFCYTEMPGLSAMWYPPEIHLKPKSRDISFVHNGPLARYVKCGLRMRRQCRERCPRHRFQRKPLDSDPAMHHGTCATHVPWCVSGSLTRGGRENVPGKPGACATRNFVYLVRGPYLFLLCNRFEILHNRSSDTTKIQNYWATAK